MNAIKTLKLMGGALIVVASFNAWSQTSDATATPSQSGATASAGTSKSAVRKANRALSKKVLQALSKGGVNTAGISVLAKGGAVSLAGHVSDPADIDKAGSIAKGVSGVTSVKNALSINQGGQ
ncbi:transport-associated protein [Caballeronia terrestris]|jgi:osmotically-inducible protein OsmY|uniref:Transport-associated protein n=1 Tax=Caballeronia terrestris TaxID=1226301 RepID=A0A158JCC5_9BURK|nr:BON domain-containing protein [Caballeronia terrestris]SAL66051.1 transport-associated protein [Caballeronia terrestris]